MKTASQEPGCIQCLRPGDRVIRVSRRPQGKISNFIHSVASLLHPGRLPRNR